MPHSSGDGGSHVGSYGGSRGGSHGRSHVSHHVRRHHFTGCRTYRRQRSNGAYDYIYSDVDIDSKIK